MIPVLYDNAERAFVTNGIGRLSDCISCVVTEERNGIYELEFEYPITGVRYKDIQEGCIVTVTHDDTGDIQPFDIYGRTAPINGIVTFYAHHVSYRLSDVVVAPCTASNPADALDKIRRNSINSNPFTFWTNKTGSGEFKVETPDYARALLGGQQGSVLDVYGKGDYEFDRWTVKLYLNRGTDSGVEIRYGKNLSDIKHDIDISESYNAVVPYWASSDGDIVMLPEKILIYSGATDRSANLTDEDWQIIRDENGEPIEVTYQIIDAKPLDLSSEFQEAPTVAQLRSLAQSKLTESEGWVPDENITVDFVQLWQTEEYKEYAPLQRVRLCDTVSVYYPEMGVEAVKSKVIKTVYNVLLDRYDSIELGKPTTTLAQAITGGIAEKVDELPTIDMMAEAIGKATDLITGGLGGYVYIKPNANGKPEEILILDNEDINQAVNVIRMNKNGIGFSSNGYQGPFESAWTIDGSFVADFIRAGSINANLITTGALNADIITSGKIQSENGRIYFDLDNNELACSYIRPAADFSGTTSENPGDTVISIARSSTNPFTAGWACYARFYRPSYEDKGFLLNPYGKDSSVNTLYSSEQITVNSAKKLHLQSGTSYIDVIGGTSGRVYLYSQTWWASVQKNTSDDHMSGLNCSRLVTGSMTLGNGINNVYVSSSGGWMDVSGNFKVTGTKNRTVKTDDYANRLLYSYETPSPLFGDVGEGVIGEDGKSYVWIDPVLAEAITTSNYQVFLQKYGKGNCWVAERNATYFVVEGDANLRFGWEIKARQKGYEQNRLDRDVAYCAEPNNTDYCEGVIEHIQTINEGRIPT